MSVGVTKSYSVECDDRAADLCWVAHDTDKADDAYDARAEALAHGWRRVRVKRGPRLTPDRPRFEHLDLCPACYLKRFPKRG